MDQKIYPPRVTRGADGAYRWRGTFNREQNLKVVKITMGVCGGFCLLLLGLGVFVDRDRSMFGVMLLSCLGAMAVAGLVSWLYYRSGGIQYQPYELTEEHVRYVGTGRSNAVYPFRFIRGVKIYADQDLIEVRGPLSFAPIFVPHEDFAFVRNYILQRLPDGTNVQEL